MVDSVRYKDWFSAGHKDLKSARILLDHDGDYTIIAFHCQQAIEKYLKGYLLLETHELEKGHSLILLIKKIQVFDSGIQQFMKDCAFVNQFYIETRYPADAPLELDQNEMKECLSIVNQILIYLNQRLQETT
ncbi:HEPN domain-containing protein [Aminipila butyrica]|uniref:HEPN domain-containing protein n=1 Tax=Aminipila butyrica TaxID=433296 RepID=A0A858BR75_9FIRM|nr:HEPN domain-containing protein [Aminipila butyrica]QIB67832.1 HEPN domain-containing protein [Aminipila butyrica]QIB67834.1 HEPN domain-containing protein [Aminipila butyrica]